MALQRAASAPPTTTAVSAGPLLMTCEVTNRPYVELGVMFGQALGGREPVMQALTNLQNIGQEHGCDAIITVRLLHYPTTAGPAVVAYGTGVRFLPQSADLGNGGGPGGTGGGTGGPVGLGGEPGAAGGAPGVPPGPLPGGDLQGSRADGRMSGAVSGRDS